MREKQFFIMIERHLEDIASYSIYLSQWAKSPKKQSEGVCFAILSKIHSYRLLFRRFSLLGYTIAQESIWSNM